MIVLAIPFAFTQEQQCELAHPTFGTIGCEKTGKWIDIGKQLQSSTTDSTVQFNCTSNCELQNKTDIRDPNGNGLGSSDKFCGGIGEWLDIQILKNGQKVWSRGLNSEPPFALIKFSSGDTFEIKMKCSWIGGSRPVNAPSTVHPVEEEIVLYDYGVDKAGKTFIAQTLGCVLNPEVQTFINSHKNPITEGQIPEKYQPKDTLVDSVTNMELGRTYGYFARWEPDPTDIGVVYDKTGQPSSFYCSGNPTNRILLSYSKITTNSGKCYYVPSTTVRTGVECCNDSDCRLKSNGQLLCDQGEFKCSDKKRCDSGIDCQVPGESDCSNKIQTAWSCNLAQPWYPSKGTCVKNETPVSCCSDNECGLNEYCDRTNGCKARYILQECPYGSCCKEGGNYKTQNCGTGLQCCASEGSIVGNCKETCAPIVTSTESTKSGTDAQSTKLPNDTSSGGKSGTSTIIVAVIVVSFLIVLAIAAGGYFIYRNLQTNAKSPLATFACPKCNSVQKSTTKFCTSCGNKLK
ncbi:MAG: hypothetical protein HY544_03815 [Candidatus Diapherotrites archaeon]|uniref:Uncharacterized protein n=1 Tax=Candidatus Iainarchaeum sp. TaxID=3101447 RepID=A0A8T3YJA8_9ARCH|nr:hypothetical protein [Candidatus Diapherotrites archaeon]